MQSSMVIRSVCTRLLQSPPRHQHVIVLSLIWHQCITTFPQVTVDAESVIRRSLHTITAITISSSLVVVVVFGGESSRSSDVLSDTVVLEFGEYTIVMKHSVVHVCMICKYQYVL